MEIYKEKLQVIKDNVPKVYESGRKVGHGEGYTEGYNKGYADSGAEEAYNNGYTDGQQAGQKSIFERIQDGGKTQNYYYAFAYDRFDDTNFFPVYPIKCSNGTTPGQYMFYNATGLTDTKVEIVANSNNINYAFHSSGLVTIRKLTVYETTNFNNTFYGLTALVNIVMGGTVGKNLSFANSSKLSVESVDSILNAAANGIEITFHSNVVGRMTDSQWAVADAKNLTIA